VRLKAHIDRINNMTQNIKNIFNRLKNVEPPQSLEGEILKAIVREKRLEIKKKLLFARTGLVVSFGALIYVLSVFGKTFLQSDFWNLAKLIFSDTGIIAGHFGDFSISLLETLPVVEIFAMLVPIFAVMMLLSCYFKFTNNNHFKHV
jgi:hypothetical protein